MQIGKYFDLTEFEHSSQAINEKIDNRVPKEYILNIQKLVDEILDPLREKYGKVIHITSGYRSHALNKLIGGSPTSQHVYGYAADIEGFNMSPEENMKLFKLIRENFLEKVGQLILESPDKDGNPAWVHVSVQNTDYSKKGEVLEFRNGKYYKI